MFIKKEKRLIKTNTISISLLFTILGGIIAYATFYMNNKRNNKLETKEDTATLTRLETMLQMISKNTDDIRLDIKDFNNSMSKLSERVTKVEESTKSAHKRIDTIEDSIRK